MKVYIVTVEECDDMGNFFQDFQGVFATLEEAADKQYELAIKNDSGVVVVQSAEIMEYDI